jgi:glutamate-1-semialdehyde aminotransferase
MARATFTGFDTPLKNRAEVSIAQGALTNSKRPECFVKGVYPTHFVRARGCRAFDTKGNRYIDFVCGLGSIILGEANEEVLMAKATASADGSALSLGSPLEVEFAERVKEIFPFIRHVKIYKSGTEACMVAVRIARAATGRKMVYSQGYHGHSDEFIGLTPPHLGVIPSQYMRLLPTDFNDISPDAAAVIIEPVMTDAGPGRRAWLQELRDYCTKHGIMLIFDEIITGFRWPKFGVSNLWGITPDLICLGKAMGNGSPISVVGGQIDVMSGNEYFASGTFAGERDALGAALKTIELLHNKYPIQTLWDAGEKFQRRFNELDPGRVSIEGYGTRGVFRGDELAKALFWQEACKAGIFFGSSWFINFMHIDLLDQVLSVCDDIFRRIRLGGVTLEGELPKSPFAARMREKQ